MVMVVKVIVMEVVMVIVVMLTSTKFERTTESSIRWQ